MCFIANAFITVSIQGGNPQWNYIAPWEFASWYSWGLVAPFIAMFVRKYPIEKDSLRYLPLYLLFAIAVSLFQLLLNVAAARTFNEIFLTPERYTFWRSLTALFFARFSWRLVVFFVIVAVCSALNFQKKFREEQRKASDLKLELVHAQLAALRMQIQPHFLFNTLNSISELMHQNVKIADEMIVRLGDFLRMTLDGPVTQEVTLERELEFLRAYLRIEEIRFQDRLTVNIQIPEETKGALVPSLILQPIVENAIRHGITEETGEGRIEVAAQKKDSTLQIQVRDNGKGLKQAIRTGLGISNTLNRLQQLYGERHTLDLSNAINKGVVVTLEIPFRT